MHLEQSLPPHSENYLLLLSKGSILQRAEPSPTKLLDTRVVLWISLLACLKSIVFLSTLLDRARVLSTLQDQAHRGEPGRNKVGISL